MWLVSHGWSLKRITEFLAARKALILSRLGSSVARFQSSFDYLLKSFSVDDAHHCSNVDKARALVSEDHV